MWEKIAGEIQAVFFWIITHNWMVFLILVFPCLETFFVQDLSLPLNIRKIDA